MRYPVDTNQLRRHALAHLGVVVWLTEHGESGVRVEIDESRADYFAFGIDGAGGLQTGVVAPMDGDAIVLNQDRSVKPGAAGTVDHHTVMDCKIKHTFLRTNRNLPIRTRRVFYQHQAVIPLERLRGVLESPLHGKRRYVPKLLLLRDGTASVNVAESRRRASRFNS